MVSHVVVNVESYSLCVQSDVCQGAHTKMLKAKIFVKMSLREKKITFQTHPQRRTKAQPTKEYPSCFSIDSFQTEHFIL